ncbi:type I polyketide synthase [Micromonospora sp. NPDC023956]|uniref:type I polyketide synthase n=1 Tax=Micromonospora sp. NPDC023956 TaxID=3155722 RepID=UPI00340662C9
MADRHPDPTPFVTRIGAQPPGRRAELVLGMVRERTGALLGWEAAAVDPDRPYLEYGYNSLAAVELTRMLSGELGDTLPLTLLYDHPTPRAVAAHLLDRLGFAEVPAAPAAAADHAAADRTDDPVAVVGMACRYPGGVTGPAGLWRLVADGVDAVSPLPTDRGWDLAALTDSDPDRRGTTIARGGGFLDDVAGFDAEFFGVSAREATAMDPQQRLLLESTWSLLEDAAIDPQSLRGSRTGVYVGLSTHDYAPLAKSGPDELQGLWGIGTAGATASGRLSYTFGLEGPTMTVDTACSSSLVAVDLARRSLLRGETSLAIAGGVAVLATPELFVEFTRQGAINADGRCRSFADTADGTGWAEGVGLVLLERLSDARRHGHRVLALLPGSAVNSDGASNGLTAPNGPAQQRVIRQALADAGLTAADIDAVEGHGTGTVLGDPIEAQALITVFGTDRPADRPLRLGSLKSNIGHAQAAAGVGGLIKLVQALHHGVLPRTLHVDHPSTKIDWSGGAVSLLTEPVPWPRGARPRRAGVSAFGVGGTNAHVIVAEPPVEPSDGPPVTSGSADPAVVPLVLAGRSAGALRDRARDIRDLLTATPEHRPVDVAAALRRAPGRFAHRAVVLGADRPALLDGLDAVAAGRSADNAVVGVPRRSGRTAFVFPGQGSQWPGMALDLLASAPPFASRFAECVDALLPHVDWAPYAVLRGEPGAADPDRVDVTQPLLFAVAVSLAELWRSYGVVPDAVLGHSQGEIAAACASGALSIRDAARVVAVRSRKIAEIAGGGAMLSVGESADRVRELIAGAGGNLAVAGLSGPRSTVVSGDAADVAAFAARCAAQDVWTRPILVDYASHSAGMEPLRGPLAGALGGLRSAAGDAEFWSTVTGGPLDPTTTPLNGEYWYRNLREPILAEQTVRRMIDAGYRTFVEISPHPVLSVPMEQIFDAVGGADEDRPVLIGSLHRDDGGLDRFARSLADADTAQVPVDWSPLTGPGDPSRVPLPGYPFQRRRYWVAARPAGWDAGAAGLGPSTHPMLGAATRLADGGGWVFTGRIEPGQPGWLAEHAVHSSVLLPGTGFVELALYAATAIGCDRVAELTIEAPLVCADSGVHLQVTVGGPNDAGEHPVAVYSRPADADPLDPEGWTCHATGSVDRAGPPVPADLTPWPGAATPLPVAGLYDTLADRGLEYGPAFRGLRAAWTDGAGRLAEVALDPQTADTAGRYLIHPALLDAAFHVGLPGDDRTYLPFRWSGVRVHRPGRAALRVRLTAAEPTRAGLIGYDDTGLPVVSVDSVTARPVTAAALGRPTDSVYRLAWGPAGTGPSTPPASVERLPAFPDADPTARVRAATGWALTVLQQLLTGESSDARVAVVTSGAVAVTPGEAPDPAAAAVWGLVRSAQSENPGRVLLVDVGVDEPLPTALPDDEPQLAIRAGTVHVPRLVPVTGPEPDGPVLRTDGTVVVTGGTGGLGAVVAEHLAVAHGVRHLLLLSRRGPDSPEFAGLAGRLAEAGATVDAVRCDVGDRAQLRAAFAGVPADRPVRAVVHAAGLLDDALVTALTADRLDRVLRPKADAALLLDELTASLDLDAFVLLSSVAGTLGGPGQGNYAAANAVLDAVAARRHAAGLPAASQVWGLWGETGVMAGQGRDADRARVAAAGIAPLSTLDGLRLFDRALGGAEPVVVLARFTRAELRAQAAAGLLPAVLRGLVPVAARPAGTGPGLAERLRGVPEQNRAVLVEELVLDAVAAVLGRPSGAGLRPDLTFKELGFDSLLAVQFRNRLSRVTGQRVATTVVFDHPTPAAIAAFLLAGLDLDAPDEGPPDVDAELDRLAALLAGVAAPDRPRVATRLRGLLREVEPAEPGTDDALADRISSADRADLINLIDSLGVA